MKFMKKVICLFLAVIMLTSLVCVPVFAESEINIKAKQAVEIIASEKSTDTGNVMIRENNYLGFEIDTNEAVNRVELHYRCGAGSGGYLDFYIDDMSGTPVGTLNTVPIVKDWANYKTVVELNTMFSGKHILYVRGRGATSAHWIADITVYTTDLVDLNARFTEFTALDDYVDVKAYGDELEIRLMSDIGAIEHDVGYFYPDLPVTRRKFFRMIGNIVKAESFSKGMNVFSDVPSDDEDARLIDGLYQLGMVRGNGSGYLYPDSFLTPNEAVMVCVNALGYGPVIRAGGSAVQVANKLRLLKGIQFDSEYLNRIESVRLIHNVLLEETLTTKRISTDGAVYEPRDSLLDESMGIKHGEGIVTGNRNTMLYSNEVNYKGVMIDGETFDEGSTSAGEYIGVKCNYYYRTENNVRTLIGIYPSARTAATVLKTCKNGKFLKITEKLVKYADDKDETEYKFDTSAAIIYNGIALDQKLSDLVNVNTFTGIITLIDNDRDGLSDAVWIDHSKTVIAGAVSGNTIYDELTKSNVSFVNSKVNVFRNEKLASFGGIENGEILNVYQSANKKGEKLVRIRINSFSEEGRISYIKNDRVEINGTEYEVSPVCRQNLNVGTTGKFYMNDFDEIVDYVASADVGRHIGLFLKAGYKNNGIEGETRVKLLTEENAIITFKMDNRIIVDGVTVKTDDELYNGVGAFCGLGKVNEKTPVTYSLDEDGRLAVLDTVEVGADNENDVLNKIGNMGSYINYDNFMIQGDTIGLMPKFPLRATTKFIKLTADGNEENFEITSGFVLPTDQWSASTTPYAIKKNSMFADIIVAQNYTYATQQPDAPFMFTGMKTRLDSEGNSVKVIVGKNADKDVEYEIDDAAYSNFAELISSLKKGDLVWPMLTRAKLTDIKLLFIDGAGVVNSAGHTTEINSSNNTLSLNGYSGRVFYGRLTDPEDGYMKLTLNGDSIWYPYAVGGKVLVCNTDANGRAVTYVAGSKEILPNDVVIAYVRGRYIKNIYIYRNDNE